MSRTRLTRSASTARPTEQELAVAERLGSPRDEWRPSVGLVLDLGAIAAAVVTAVVVIVGSTPVYRPVLVLLFTLAAPGWAILRAGGAPPTSLTLFGAVGLSVAVQLIAGEVVATRTDWTWRPAVVAVAGATVVLGIAGLCRGAAGRARRWMRPGP